MALLWKSFCQKVHMKRHFLTPLTKSEPIFFPNKLLRVTNPTFSISPLFGYRSSCSSVWLTSIPPYILNMLSCLDFPQYIIGSLLLKLLPSSFPHGFCILDCPIFYKWSRGFCSQTKPLLAWTRKGILGNCQLMGIVPWQAGTASASSSLQCKGFYHKNLLWHYSRISLPSWVRIFFLKNWCQGHFVQIVGNTTWNFPESEKAIRETPSASCY